MDLWWREHVEEFDASNWDHVYDGMDEPMEDYPCPTEPMVYMRHINRLKVLKASPHSFYCGCDRAIRPTWVKCCVCGARRGRYRLKKGGHQGLTE
jgi:hypothetical protein